MKISILKFSILVLLSGCLPQHLQFDTKTTSLTSTSPLYFEYVFSDKELHKIVDTWRITIRRNGIYLYTLSDNISTYPGAYYRKWGSLSKSEISSLTKMINELKHQQLPGVIVYLSQHNGSESDWGGKIVFSDTQNITFATSRNGRHNLLNIKQRDSVLAFIEYMAKFRAKLIDL